MCSALADVCFGPIADIEVCMPPWFSDKSSRAWQDNPDFGELARLRIDLDCARMLLHDDVVADGEAKAGSLSRRLGREERVEHPFLHVRRHTSAVVANPDFYKIAKVFGRGCEGRLEVAAVCFRSAPGRGMEAI